MLVSIFCSTGRNPNDFSCRFFSSSQRSRRLNGLGRRSAVPMPKHVFDAPKSFSGIKRNGGERSFSSIIAGDKGCDFMVNNEYELIYSPKKKFKVSSFRSLLASRGFNKRDTRLILSFLQKRGRIRLCLSCPNGSYFEIINKTEVNRHA